MDLKRVDRVFRILPKEERYYELFNTLVGAVVRGCDLLAQLFAESGDWSARVAELKTVEHAGDDATREIMALLQKSFVTPIDREDIDALATALDDILDGAYTAASFAELSSLPSSNDALRALSTSLAACAHEVSSAVEHLNDQDGISGHCASIHRLETEADAQYREAIRNLFSGSASPVDVIRLKELYECIEGSIDRCEDVANILERIVIKNS